MKPQLLHKQDAIHIIEVCMEVHVELRKIFSDILSV
jgi:hypothetical protein